MPDGAFGAALPQPPEQLPTSELSSRFRPTGPSLGRLCRGPRARDYRPGDSPRKFTELTAKVDHPIVREAQVLNQGPVVLTLDLSGSPGELDSCLDQTCWLAQWLLAHGTAHVVRWLSGTGPQACSIHQPQDLSYLAEQLCRSSPTPAGSTSRTWAADACWHYHVLPRRRCPREGSVPGRNPGF
ncbi:MAG: DUF58 domain-containing protein [Oscillospiraceae bacterium]